jgi:hypothetical protein
VEGYGFVVLIFSISSSSVFARGIVFSLSAPFILYFRKIVQGAHYNIGYTLRYRSFEDHTRRYLYLSPESYNSVSRVSSLSRIVLDA